MQIKEIEYFLTIVNEKSFTAAAEKLFISQSALSQHIKKLESELGTELFDRSSHSAKLTEAGELFLQDGGHLFELYGQMLQRIRSLDTVLDETVHFGLSPFYSRYYLPRLLLPLLSVYPNIKISITEDYSRTLEKALLENKLDFALVPLVPRNPELEYRIVYWETILLAVPKKNRLNDFSIPSKGYPFIDLSLFKNEPFVALQKYQKFSDMAEELCNNAGFSPSIVCETMNWDTLNMLVASGMGVGFVPDILTTQLDESTRPFYYQISPGSQRAYTIAYRKNTVLSPSANCVMDSFKNTFEHMNANTWT